ncbi:hypothetical protein SAMN05443245_7614 [Paraburkholderia fungorum]|uniref:Uncharacterized protein n=1 Tax=Paraburkholderia fungorum TaxID=134537 RepID=A0A1H1JZW6_9BURK|nr:hypothetical protein [Paraburkholderia fungorum]SDR55165.1 hypothetical protein SAMN05443245_7614 [Paraburkholderia fungorum]
MIANLTDAWSSLKNVPNIVGIFVAGMTAVAGATGALFGVVITALVSLRNTRKTLDGQRVTAARSASTFIGDKRQKWIDDLRDDMALFIANTHELVAIWLMFVIEQEDDNTVNPMDAARVAREHLKAHIKLNRDNTERDAAHQQVLTRIRFRLNPLETEHLELLKTLYRVGHALETMVNGIARREILATKLSSDIYQDLDKCAAYTTAIFKGEWNRIAREVAEPEKLLESIIAKPLLNVGALAAELQKRRLSIRPTSVASKSRRGQTP